MPHAGLLVPEEDAAVLALDERGRKGDADLHCDALTAFVAGTGASRVVAHVSRYVLDVNRAPDDVDDALCPAWPGARPSPRGLCWRVTTDNKAVSRRALSRAEVESRIARLHTPYHAALTSLLHARVERFGHAVLLDVHSMPSVGKAAHLDAHVPRADLVPGDALGTACAPALLDIVDDVATAAGMTVKPNDPYRGGYITRHHGRPRARVHALQLELNRALYMNEGTFALSADGGARVESMLRALVARLSAWSPRER